MATSQNPKAGSNGSGTGFDVQTSIERSFALALAPFRQGLRLYADFQRSALDAFTRATGATVAPVTASMTRPKAAAEPTVTPKRAATKKPAATKRPTTAKPAGTKRPTTSKPAAEAPRAGGATGRTAAKKPAAAKAAPKGTRRSSATAAKPAVAKVAKKAASAPPRPRGARANAAKKA